MAGPIVYEVTTSANPSAYGTTAGDGFYPNGSSVTVTATANAGYVFTNWTDNGVVVSTSASYTFTISADTDLVANFVPAVSYTVTASADPSGSGTVSGARTYYSGQTATLTAVANAGYGFVNWTVGGVEVSTTAQYSFEVTGDVSLVANFGAVYTITTDVSPVGSGTVTGGGTYGYGATVNLVASPSTLAYEFVGWSDGNTDNPRTITVTQDATYTAVFVEITLPSNFIPVNILGAKNCYFDTGVYPSDDLNITGLFYSNQASNADGSLYLFGARNTNRETAAGQLGYCAANTSNNNSVYYGSTKKTTSNKIKQIWVSNEGVFFDDISTGRYDGVEFTASTFTGTQTMYILGMNNAGTYLAGTSSAFAMIAVFQIDQNGNTIHKYIPCYDTDTQTFVLYDLIDATALSKQGTGTFDSGALLEVKATTGGSAFIEMEGLGYVTKSYQGLSSEMADTEVDSDYIYNILGSTIWAEEEKGYYFKYWTNQNGDIVSRDRHTWVRLHQDDVLTANFAKRSELQNGDYQLMTIQYGSSLSPIGNVPPIVDGRVCDFYTSVYSFSCAVDGLARTTSTIVVDELPAVYRVDSPVILFSPRGQLLYMGIITGIDGKTLTCREILSVVDFPYLIQDISGSESMSATNKAIAMVLQYSMFGSPTYNSAINAAVHRKNSQFSIKTGTIFQYPRYERSRNQLFNLPAVDSPSVENAEDYMIDLFDQFGLVVEFGLAREPAVTTRVPNKSYLYPKTKYLDQLPSLVIGTNVECITNVNINTEYQNCTTIDVFNSSGSTLRGKYALKKDGTVGDITNIAIGNMEDLEPYIAFDECRRDVVLSDDPINTITRQYLGNALYNHKITFNVDLTTEAYHFYDFVVGRKVKFYDGDKVYDSIITGYSFKYSDGDVRSLSVILGNVRTSLTEKLNLGRLR